MLSPKLSRQDSLVVVINHPEHLSLIYLGPSRQLQVVTPIPKHRRGTVPNALSSTRRKMLFVMPADRRILVRYDEVKDMGLGVGQTVWA